MKRGAIDQRIIHTDTLVFFENVVTRLPRVGENHTLGQRVAQMDTLELRTMKLLSSKTMTISLKGDHEMTT